MTFEEFKTRFDSEVKRWVGRNRTMEKDLLQDAHQDEENEAIDENRKPNPERVARSWARELLEEHNANVSGKIEEEREEIKEVESEMRELQKRKDTALKKIERLQAARKKLPPNR